METLFKIGVLIEIVGGVIFFAGLFVPLPTEQTAYARYNKIAWATIGTGEVLIIIGLALLTYALYFSPH